MTLSFLRHVDARRTIRYHTNCAFILTPCFYPFSSVYSTRLDVRLAQYPYYMTYFSISLTCRAHHVVA